MNLTSIQVVTFSQMGHKKGSGLNLIYTFLSLWQLSNTLVHLIIPTTPLRGFDRLILQHAIAIDLGQRRTHLHAHAWIVLIKLLSLAVFRHLLLIVIPIVRVVATVVAIAIIATLIEVATQLLAHILSIFGR